MIDSKDAGKFCQDISITLPCQATTEQTAARFFRFYRNTTTGLWNILKKSFMPLA